MTEPTKLPLIIIFDLKRSRGFEQDDLVFITIWKKHYVLFHAAIWFHENLNKSRCYKLITPVYGYSVYWIFSIAFQKKKVKTSKDVCKTHNIMLGKTSQNKILVLGKIIRFVSMWDRSNIHKYEPTPIERWIYYFVKNIKINLSFFHGINIKKKKNV